MIRHRQPGGQAMTVKITRADVSASARRHEASRTNDAPAVRRMLAIALVLEGCSRSDAARQCGMDRQTLRDWVHRFNEEGLDGLFDRAHGGGAPRKLSVEQEAGFEAWVRAGPDPETDGIVRWRLIDLRERISRTFAVELHERSIGKLARRLGFRRISVRPRHPQADAAAQDAHKKTSVIWYARRSPKRSAAVPLSSGGKMKPGSANRAI
jgi:transposase